jgi:hypothetical protein
MRSEKKSFDFVEAFYFAGLAFGIFLILLGIGII